MTDLRGLCIHQVSFGLDRGFAECTEPLARAGITKTAVWYQKLADIGVAAAARILRDTGVQAISLCPGGVLSQTDATAFETALDANRRMLEVAAEIGCTSMVTISGGLDEGETDLRFARDRALEGIAQLLPDAREAGVKLAIEPLHPITCANRGVLTTTSLALDWCDVLDADDIVGVALDTYAIWWDPDVQAQIARAGSRLLNLHIADWRRDTRDVRFDRAMPGEGAIEMAHLIGAARNAGFAGPLEVELFSSFDWWKADPDDTVAAIARWYTGLTDVERGIN